MFLSYGVLDQVEAGTPTEPGSGPDGGRGHAAGTARPTPVRGSESSSLPSTICSGLTDRPLARHAVRPPTAPGRQGADDHFFSGRRVGRSWLVSLPRRRFAGNSNSSGRTRAERSHGVGKCPGAGVAYAQRRITVGRPHRGERTPLPGLARRDRRCRVERGAARTSGAPGAVRSDPRPGSGTVGPCAILFSGRSGAGTARPHVHDRDGCWPGGRNRCHR